MPACKEFFLERACLPRETSIAFFVFAAGWLAASLRVGDANPAKTGRQYLPSKETMRLIGPIRPIGPICRPRAMLDRWTNPMP
jgi:hypothetical protein